MDHILLTDLRAAREAQGLSRAALADRIGRDEQTIKRAESGAGTLETLTGMMTALSYHLSGLAKGHQLAVQLRAARINRGWSKAHAATRAAITRSTVTKVENCQGSIRSALALLEVLGPKARRRAPERSHWMIDALGDRDARFTPPEFLDVIQAVFGQIDLDPCGHVSSPVLATRRILQSDGGDGMAEEWIGRLVYVNPPFSALIKWLRRADEQWHLGNAETIVCLVPARTDSTWFHDRLRSVADIHMLRGRLRFATTNDPGHRAPFAMMLVVFGCSRVQRGKWSEMIDGFWLPRPENFLAADCERRDK